VVDLTLKPGSRRQLDENEIIVFWRDGQEPGSRDGLVCALSMCPHPDCSCGDAWMEGVVIDGHSGSERKYKHCCLKTV